MFPANESRSGGQAGVVPVQDSTWSHGPALGRQTVAAAVNVSGAQALL